MRSSGVLQHAAGAPPRRRRGIQHPVRGRHALQQLRRAAVAQLRSERGGVPPRHRRRVLHQLLRQEGRPAGRRALLQLPQLHRLDERGGSRVLPVRRQAMPRELPRVRGRAGQQPRPASMPPTRRATSRAPRRRRRDGHALRRRRRRDGRGWLKNRPRFAPRRAAVARALRRPRRALHAPRTRAVTPRHPRGTPRDDGEGGEEGEREVDPAPLRPRRRGDRGAQRARKQTAEHGHLPQ